MRLFIIGLVALNLVYFIWNSLGDSQPVAEKPAIARGAVDVPLLVRLNEADNPPLATSPVPTAFDLPNEPQIMAVEQQATGRYCYTLGPFLDAETMEQMQNQLMATGITADARETKERKQRGFWVYLPSYASREEALAVSRQLAANGLRDYFVINDEKNKHAISLGLFSKKKGSERRLREVRAMGLEPKLETRYREEAIFWLDYETVEPFNNVDSIIGVNRDKTIEQLDRECS